MKCLVCGARMKLVYEGLFDDRYGAPGKHDIYRCLSCGFGRTVPGLKPNDIGKFYAKYYPLSRQSAQAVRKSVSVLPKWQAWLKGTNNIAHHYIKPGMKVLDVGSASGVSLLEIQALGGKAYGVEPDQSAARLARQLKLKVFTGFITDNPFPGEKFDVITASQVIEHTPDPRKFLKALSFRLKDDGYAVLSFPNFDAFYRKVFGRRWLHWHVPYHYNFFTKDSFEELAKSVGLEVYKIKTITPNLWTIIQSRMLPQKPIERRIGNIWKAQHNNSGKPKKTNSLLSVLELTVRKILRVRITLVNRTLDVAGYGESFLVFLAKSNKK